MKNLRYSLVLMTALFLVVFMAASYPVPSFALTTDELRQEIEKKNADIKKLEADETEYRSTIATSQKTAATLKNQIGQIDKNVQSLNTKITVTNTKISKTDLEITLLQQGIAEKEGAISKEKAGMATIMQRLAEKDREESLAILIKNNSLSRFFGSINEFFLIQKRFDEYVSHLKQLRNELGIQKASAETKKDELSQLSEELDDQKILQKSQRVLRSQLLSQTKNKEQAYQSLLKQNQQQQEQFQKELEALEEKLRVLVDPSSLPPTRKSFFAWPARGRLSQGYGRTSFAVRSDFYQFHNGIDIANAYGTPITAPYGGRVATVGDNDKYCPRGAYGKFILIDHENNLTTLYAHFSLIKVKAGDTVEKGQLIGYMGTSGLSTGSHLHFTVYDSRTLEVKQSRVCGPMPYGGSVNPLDYL